MSLNKEIEAKMWQAFLETGKEGLYADHYKLTEITGLFTPSDWKEFLLQPPVVEHIRVEMELIRKAAINELFSKAGDSNSVGKAQLMNAIAKYDEDNQAKEGPIFIYTYVPLNPEQAKADNVRQLTEDIFLSEEEIRDSAAAPTIPTRRP